MTHAQTMTHAHKDSAIGLKQAQKGSWCIWRLVFFRYVEEDAEGQSIYFLNTHFVGGRFEDTDFIAATEYRRKPSQAINQWAQDKSVVLVGDFNAPQDFH